jgi:hypothetical protein
MSWRDADTSTDIVAPLSTTLTPTAVADSEDGRELSTESGSVCRLSDRHLRSQSKASGPSEPVRQPDPVADRAAVPRCRDSSPGVIRKPAGRGAIGRPSSAQFVMDLGHAGRSVAVCEVADRVVGELYGSWPVAAESGAQVPYSSARIRPRARPSRARPRRADPALARPSRARPRRPDREARPTPT